MNFAFKLMNFATQRGSVTEEVGGHLIEEDYGEDYGEDCGEDCGSLLWFVTGEVRGHLIDPAAAEGNCVAYT